MSDSRSAPQVRSWLITEAAEFVTGDARAQLMQRVSVELRSLLEQRRREREAWAPLALFHEVLIAADAIAGRGDLKSCWDIGRSIAQKESGVVRSFALRFLRPAAVISLATSLWQVHYRHAGRVSSQVAGPSSMRFSVLDYPTPHRAHCLSVGGWAQGALELGPRRSVRVEQIACRCDRAATCDFLVSWQEG